MPPVTGPPPPADPAVVARFMDALLGEEGGGHGSGPEREAAEMVRRTWPGVGGGIRAADAFHARAAACLAAAGATGIVFCGLGYPPCRSRMPHLPAVRAVPGTRAAYSSGGPAVTLVWQGALGGDPPAWQARGDRPRQVAGMARMAGMEGPLQVHLRLALHWLPPDYAAEVVAGYARALPAGSALVMSGAVPGAVPQSPHVVAAVRRAVAPTYAHSAADIAGWVKAAGMRLDEPGVTDVRLWPLRAAGQGGPPARPAGWFAGAVALRP